MLGAAEHADRGRRSEREHLASQVGLIAFESKILHLFLYYSELNLEQVRTNGHNSSVFVKRIRWAVRHYHEIRQNSFEDPRLFIFGNDSLPG